MFCATLAKNCRKEKDGRKPHAFSASASPSEEMDHQHKEIRRRLSTMAPRRAREYILAFELQPYEEVCLIECEVNGKSTVEVARQINASPEFVKKKRRSAFSKIADQINNP